MDTLEIDLDSKMLVALTTEPETVQTAEIDNLSLDDKNNYLKQYINSVSKADRCAIGSILIMHDKKNELHECAEGTVINLSTIPEHIITQMYELIRHKIEKR